ncbi:hypothetical protein [Streptomyces sp. NPDC002851]
MRLPEAKETGPEAQAAVSEAARALAARCEPRVNELARRMSRESFAHLPGYAELPIDMKDVEIAATARHGIRGFLRAVRRGRGPAGGVNALFLERAAQRADEGMPLHLLLRVHTLGMHVLWRALRESAGPGEEAALVELADLMLRFCPDVVGTVAQTYVDERTALEAEQQEERRTLVRGLLDGTCPPDAAVTAQLGLDGPGRTGVGARPRTDTRRRRRPGPQRRQGRQRREGLRRRQGQQG